MNQKYDFGITSDNVCVLPSATAALFAAIQAVVDPGDEVGRLSIDDGRFIADVLTCTPVHTSVSPRELACMLIYSARVRLAVWMVLWGARDNSTRRWLSSNHFFRGTRQSCVRPAACRVSSRLTRRTTLRYRPRRSWLKRSAQRKRSCASSTRRTTPRAACRHPQSWKSWPTCVWSTTLCA